MLLRLSVQNFHSFKEEVEFNTFPSSKSHNHESHKVACGFATALRLSAIYGANGAGKSALIESIHFLKTLVKDGNLNGLPRDGLKFQFDVAYQAQPTAIAVEFYKDGVVYYYHIEFESAKILFEELLLSKKTTDIWIFKRIDNKIEINEAEVGKKVTPEFIDALSRLVRPEMSLLSFLGKSYPEEFVKITSAYHWFVKELQILLPNAFAKYIPHLLDTKPDFQHMASQLLPKMNTGITRLEVKKETIQEDSVKPDSELSRLILKAKEFPGMPFPIRSVLGEVANVVFENDVAVKKTLIPIHKCSTGKEMELPLVLESDGTKRLIEYMPLLYSTTYENSVYIVDEIERSMHPVMIKQLMKDLSASDKAKGQLIFTTHESGLLDQDIFRPDEIWFAQKDVEQATQLYSLSDFNIHRTANIENGYLNGRYGGIPFMSNLEALHW